MPHGKKHCIHLGRNTPPPACSHIPKAGDRLKALKCLLKSGDTKSIIYYAGVSRSRDIYILAANYLQNLDWHDDPQVGNAEDRWQYIQ